MSDIFDNPTHSRKKESRPLGSPSRRRPPKIPGKKCLNRRLFGSKPVMLMKNTERNLCFSQLYDESLSIPLHDQCFEQVAKIGEGSFGIVYKVRHKGDGQYYALKKSKEVYRGKSDRDKKILEVHRYETVPVDGHVVRLMGAWEQDEHIFLVMELGIISLDRYIMDRKEVSELQAWNILVDMLLALKILHDANLIHLDVKLENIILCEDGVCKLGDFGLLMDLKGDLRSATEGDAKYLAPELMDGKFTKAADVFSLGISMLELACDLELPSHGKLWHNLRQGIFPNHIVKNVPRELFNIIKRMMLKDFKKRPSVKSLLRHPRIKSLLKQRREAAAKGLNLDGRLTPPARTSTPLFGSSAEDTTDPFSTPPVGYSTPSLSVLLSSYNSSMDSPSSLEPFADKSPFPVVDRSSPPLMDLSPPLLVGGSPQQLMSTSEFPPYITPITTSAKRQTPVFSSAKKLHFLFDE